MAFSIPSQPPYGDQEEMEGSLELGFYGQEEITRRGILAAPPFWFAPTASRSHGKSSR